MKVVIGTNGTPTATEATIGDIVTTAFSSDSAVTGTYGLIQRGAFLVAGMSLQNYRKTGSLNPLA